MADQRYYQALLDLIQKEEHRIQAFYKGDQQYLLEAQELLVANFGSVLSSTKLQEILNNPDQLDRVLTLIAEVREQLIENQNLAGNLDVATVQANVQEFEAHKKREQQLEAEAELARRGQDAQEHHLKAQRIIQQLQAQVRAKSPQAAETLAQDAEIIESLSVLAPETIISQIQESVATTAPPEGYTEVQIASDTAALVELVAPFNPAVQVFAQQIHTHLPPELPTASRNQTTNTIIAYSQRHPQTPKAQAELLWEHVTVKAESQGHKLNLPEADLSNLLHQQNWRTPSDQLLQTHLRNSLTAAGMDPQAVEAVAQTFSKQDLAPFVYVASKSTDAEQAPKQRRRQEIENLKAMQSLAVTFALSKNFSGKRFVQQLTIYANYFNAVPDEAFDLPYQLYQDSFSPQESTHIGKIRSQGYEFGNWILSQGQSYLGGKTKNVVLNNVRSLLGKTAVKAGTAAAGAAEGAAVGTATIPVPVAGTITGAVLGWIVSHAQDIASLAQRHSKTLLESLGGGFAILGGSLGSALGGVAFGVPGFFIGAAGGYGLGGMLGGKSMAMQKFGNFASGAFNSLPLLVATEIVWPLIIIGLSVPIVLTLLLFIINTSALVVPVNPFSPINPGLISSLPYTGPLPAGCPDIWPITGTAPITQGARVPTSLHRGTEAIDIGVTLADVVATHDGIAQPKQFPGGQEYGNYIEVLSTCTYKGNQYRILSRYAHLNSFLVGPNTQVNKGDVIGISGDSGNGPFHLHYEFRLDNNTTYGLATSLELDIPPFMWPNFIPKEIKRGCVNQSACAANIP